MEFWIVSYTDQQFNHGKSFPDKVYEYKTNMKENMVQMGSVA